MGGWETANERPRWPKSEDAEVRLRVGRTLADALTVLRHHVFAFWGLAAALYFLPVALAWVAPFPSHGAFWAMRTLQLGLTLGIPFLVAGLLSPGVFEATRGVHVGFGQLLAAAWPRLPTLLVVCVLLAGAVGLTFGVAIFFAGFLVAVTGSFVALPIFAVMLFALVMIALFVCRFYVALPVAAVEGAGPLAALGRSSRLTLSRRWTILGIVLVFAVLSYVVELLLERFLSPDAALAGTAVWIGFAAHTLVGAWQATAVTVAYATLRREKDGVAEEDLATIFE